MLRRERGCAGTMEGGRRGRLSKRAGCPRTERWFAGVRGNFREGE